MEKFAIKDLKENQTFDLGTYALTEEEIINFARLNDPLPFHTDKEAAKKSMFKGLVASGSHIFTVFYNKQWVPAYGLTVLCGLELNNWRFMRPIYAGQPIHCIVTISLLRLNPEKGHVVITWKYEFFDTKNEMVQMVYVTVLHHLQ